MWARVEIAESLEEELVRDDSTPVEAVTLLCVTSRYEV